MKKVFILFIIIITLTACNHESVLSENFKSDVEQVLPIIEKAHKEQKDYTDHDSDLFEKFHDKYKRGQYYIKNNDDYYEMNDIEKAILNKINTMRVFAVDLIDEDSAVLASEKDNDIDYYEEAKENLDELMELNKVDDLAEEFKGKYPTYEIVKGIYPEQFEDDVNNLIELFDPIINGDQTDVEDKEWHPLKNFLDEYQGENKEYPTDYEQKGKHYLINNQMKDMIKLFYELKSDIEEGSISSDTMDDFNLMKEDIDLFGGI